MPRLPADPALRDLLMRMHRPDVHCRDGRRERRHESDRVATLRIGRQALPVGCVIEDVSHGGCRLRLMARTAITPGEEIELYIPCCRRTLPGHVVWQRGDEIGLAIEADGAKEAATFTRIGGEKRCLGVSPGSGGRASCAASSKAGWCRNR